MKFRINFEDQKQELNLFQVPRQNNLHDCGLYMLHFFELVIRDCLADSLQPRVEQQQYLMYDQCAQTFVGK